MDLRALGRNVSVAFAAQALTFAVSAVVTLFVPKALDVEQFGYWQLFVFYSSYSGLFMLGLNDGCYLLNGGKRRDELDARSVNSQFLIGVLFEVALGLCLLAAVLCSGLPEERAFVLDCIAVFIVLRCSAAFLGYLFQAVNETGLYSGSCILERLLFLVAVLVFLALGVDDFRLYVVAFCLSTLCQLAFCLYHARDILRVGLSPARDAFRDTFLSVRVGIKLMLANIASMLIVGVARFAIDATWGISSFGQLSLSLTLCTFFLAFVSQFAMVLFPALRRSEPEEVKAVVAYARDFLSLFMPATYLLVFPAYLACVTWLPQYATGLGYLALVLPICVFDSKTSLCCFTYYKVARLEGRMLAVNCATVVVSMAGVFAGVLVAGSVDAVVLAAVVAVAGRSVFCERDVARLLEIGKASRITAGELALTCIVVACHFVADMPTAFAVCLASYALFLLLGRSKVRSVLSPIARRLGLSGKH